jgi:hypothetical protein
MSDILLQPLNDLQALTQTLFQSLSPAQTRPPPVPSISTFLEADAALAAAVKLARKHQIKQRKNERLKEEFLALEERWRNIVQELEQGKRELDVILTEGDERIRSIEVAKAGAFYSVRRCSIVQTRFVRCYTIPGAPCICAEYISIHLCAAQHARARPWATAAAALLPAVPKRRKDAPRPHERRGTSGPTWGDARSRKRCVFD